MYYAHKTTLMLWIVHITPSHCNAIRTALRVKKDCISMSSALKLLYYSDLKLSCVVLQSLYTFRIRISHNRHGAVSECEFRDLVPLTQVRYSRGMNVRTRPLAIHHILTCKLT